MALVLGLCAAQELTGPVVRVIDGDTIVVRLAGKDEHVRYIGIDTPERDDPRPEMRALARRATEANRRLVEGRSVRLELDAETRDRYGRLLAYVWVGDTLVNDVLVREGHAAPYTVPPNVRYAERFRAAAREARARDERRAESRVGARAGETPGGSSDELDASEAAAHVGEVATVCGDVASTRALASGSRLTFLNLGAPYPDQQLTVLIRPDARRRFPEPPERAFRDRRICVTGRIGTYRGTPQIEVTDPERIRLASP